MICRRAELRDLDSITQLFDAYRVYYKKESDLKKATEFIKERIHQNDSEIFVAETTENQLVGFVQLYPLFSSTRMQKLWLLNDLFVNPNFRGKGVSIQLIDKAKQLVKESKACGLILETEKSNLIGNNLYPKTGFELNTSCNFYEWDVQ